MKVILDCPYEQRNQAKALGARWDPAIKKWYVMDPPDLAPFASWLPGNVADFVKQPSAGVPNAAPRPARSAASRTPQQPRRQSPRRRRRLYCRHGRHRKPLRTMTALRGIEHYPGRTAAEPLQPLFRTALTVVQTCEHGAAQEGWCTEPAWPLYGSTRCCSGARGKQPA